MVNYDIVKELENIKIRMWNTHLQDDRIFIDDAIAEIKENRKMRSLLEKCAEEIENLYGKETDLSIEIRGLLNE